MAIATISIFGRPTTVEILQGRAPQLHEFSMIGGCTLQIDDNSSEDVDFSYLILPGMELEFEVKANPCSISIQTFSVDARDKFIAKSPTFIGDHSQRRPFKGSIVQLRRGAIPLEFA